MCDDDRLLDEDLDADRERVAGRGCEEGEAGGAEEPKAG